MYNSAANANLAQAGEFADVNNIGDDEVRRRIKADDDAFQEVVNRLMHGQALRPRRPATV